MYKNQTKEEIIMQLKNSEASCDAIAIKYKKNLRDSLFE